MLNNSNLRVYSQNYGDASAQIAPIMFAKQIAAIPDESNQNQDLMLGASGKMNFMLGGSNALDLYRKSDADATTVLAAKVNQKLELQPADAQKTVQLGSLTVKEDSVAKAQILSTNDSNNMEIAQDLKIDGSEVIDGDFLSGGSLFGTTVNVIRSMGDKRIGYGFRVSDASNLELYKYDDDSFITKTVMVFGSGAATGQSDTGVRPQFQAKNRNKQITLGNVTAPAVSDLWTRSGSDIYLMNSNVGIGTTAPRGKLEVAGNAYVTGAANLASVSVSGVSALSNLSVSGAASFAGLSSSGVASLAQLEASGAVSMNGAATFNAAAVFKGAVSFSNSVALASNCEAAGYVQARAFKRWGISIIDELLSGACSNVVLNGNRIGADSNLTNLIADAAYPVRDSNLGAWRYVNNSNAYPAVKNLATNTWNKINWYYGQNQSLSNVDMKVANLGCHYARIRINNAATTVIGNPPFFAMYTMPQGDGKDKAAWYRSSRTYNKYMSTPVINKDIIIYVGQDPRNCGFNLVAEQFIELQNDPTDINFYRGPVGQTTFAPTEVFSLLSLQTNSAASVGTVDFSLLEMGYRQGATMVREVCYF